MRIQIYKVVGNEVFLSLSADASCQGLLTASEGPLVMELTEGYTAAAGCPFPAWFKRNTWQDLTSRHHYSMHDDGVVTYALSERRHERREKRVLAKYQCVRQFKENRNETLTDQFSEAIMVLTKVLDDWYTFYYYHF